MWQTQNSRYGVGFGFLILIQIVIALQGFDVCDEGSKLTFFQNFYSDIGSVRYNFVHYMSGIFGGVWYNLFPTGGILWFRLLTILVQSTTLLIALRLFKNIPSIKFIFWGLCIALFLNDFGFLGFYHNHLTALISMLVVIILFYAVQNGNTAFYALAGVLVGINIFTRIPNVLLVSYGLIVFYEKLFLSTKTKWAVFLKRFLLFFLGVIFGVLIVFLVQIYQGHFSYMLEALDTLFHFSQASDSDHNLLRIIKMELFNYFVILKYMTVLTVLYFVFLFAYARIYSRKFKLIALSIVFLTIFSYLIFVGGIRFFYAFCTLILFYILFYKNSNERFRLLAFLSLITMYVTPLGSSEGIFNAGYICLWTALPLSIGFIASRNPKTALVSMPFQGKSSTLFATLLILAALLTKGYQISHNAYFDYGPRWKKTHSVNSEFARGIYTTKEKALIINELLEILPKYISPGDLLLTYDSIPMIHFFTQTRPFMYNPWVWIYDGATFTSKLNKAVHERSYLPIVVQQKFETIGGFGDPSEFYLREDKTREVYSYSVERVIAFNTFLKENRYSILWSNDYFNIYGPSKTLEN